jgi:hypothetical protein
MPFLPSHFQSTSDFEKVGVLANQVFTLIEILPKTTPLPSPSTSTIPGSNALTIEQQRIIRSHLNGSFIAFAFAFIFRPLLFILL